MSERFKIKENKNASKNTRLPIAEDFANYRFNRDELAHVSRYLFVCEYIINLAKNLRRPVNVLDIGCGDIYIARVLQSSFVVKKTDVISHYEAVDIDENIVKRAKDTAPGSFEIRVHCLDITTGGLKIFKDKSFDLVVCLETIEHIQPRFVPGLLQEIKRIGSRGILSTPNFDGGTGKIPEDHVKEWCYDELRQAYRDAGIRILEEIGVFSNINKVKEIAKQDKTVANILNYLEPRVDSNFLSIIMAKFIGRNAQNILRICEL